MVDAYNGTTGKADAGYSTGASDLNVFYDTGHVAWITVSSLLVLLMIPGVGLFYSGLARRKSALQLVLLSMLSVGVISFQWFFWGYSLTFSRTGNAFLGDLTQFGLMKTLAQPNGSAWLPDILLCLYQGMFAAITPALAIGAVADRGRMLPAIIFMFIWSTVVYDPIAYWTWNANGWLFKLPAYDFAGGGPVHIASGTCALAYSIMLGKRTGYDKNRGLPYRPHSVTNVVLGTVFLWVGWFGFNGGSALGMNLRAVMACLVTNLAASVGGVTWILLDYRLEKKWSTIGFCSGAVAGLVAITPAAGFVPPWSAFIIGVVGATCCNFATKLKFVIGVDDTLDIFAIHGIGGMAGNIMTGIFGTSTMASLDGNVYPPSAGSSTTGSNSATKSPASAPPLAGLSLRVSPEDEDAGVDDCQLGEFAYDYVELTRHVATSAAEEVGGHTTATVSESSSTHEKTPVETV
ncbi:Ammonium transporter 1 [Cladobotryum mycophilum]|uniref:Ammonium transporter n=1 Tax=Cladobotryum mycophilum TaxID=491253 RepID=A0ABR0SVF5_9HYPO